VSQYSKDRDTIINGFTKWGVWFKPPRPHSSSSREDSLDYETNFFPRFVTPSLLWDMEKRYGATKEPWDI
jgi:hypothetical protein